MKKPLVVAVDGPAGSGKSSVSREVAVACGLKYIDSGALYRAITWFTLENLGEVSADTDYTSLLQKIELTQRFNSDGSVNTQVNGRDVSEDIRNERITGNIGKVSDSLDVRSFVTELLRSWGASESIIMDGRDIGTVVFPDANLKIYLDASVDTRAMRRFREYEEKGKKVDLNAIKEQIMQRDDQDRSRPVGALKQAEDAQYLDSSDLSRDQVVERFIQYIRHAGQ